MTKKQQIDRLWRDLIAGLVVFLVALPLCLGVALASNPQGNPMVPMMAGLIAGIVGGLIIGPLSGSSTSVSGPAAGLTAIVASTLVSLGSFEAFLLALVLAGIFQIGLGLIRAGVIASYFPTSVIQGLLAAIGLLLILKQAPHLVGHDTDPDGEMQFEQPDGQNTFSELWETIKEIQAGQDFQPGAAIAGGLCILIIWYWGRNKRLKKSVIPSALVVVVFGVLLNELLKSIGIFWAIQVEHLVQVPKISSDQPLSNYLNFPNWQMLNEGKIYIAALTIGIVATLETLLNLEAVDKQDPLQRVSPPNRELIAQGVGNITCGLIGGLPVTSVIVRSSVNINSGGKTKFSTIFHGIFLLTSLLVIPNLLNLIPLSALAAILIMTGFKLFNWKKFRELWNQGYSQFVPFTCTIIAIVYTDLLIGVVIGLCVSIYYILHNSLNRPVKLVIENHVTNDVVRVFLGNQLHFLNRVRILEILDHFPKGSHVLLDARDTTYIDPDILSILHDFKTIQAPVRGIQVSTIGFLENYHMQDQILYVDYTSREARDSLTPDQVLNILKEGHERFISNTPISRFYLRQIHATAESQTPMAVVLSCIDSRAPVEILFDLGLGDVFTIRIAGNVTKEKVLASIEYACLVAGAKLIVVMGHSRCGAVTAAVNFAIDHEDPVAMTGCEHLEALLREIRKSIHPDELNDNKTWTDQDRIEFIEEIAHRNVNNTIQTIQKESETLRQSIEKGKIKIVSCFYDVSTGMIKFED